MKSLSHLSTAQALLAAVLIAGPAGALAAEWPAREQLERFSRGLDSLEAQFEQRVLRADGSVEDESAGKLWLKHPHFFRWEYGGDFPEIVVGDGERIWVYDEVLEQVTVKPQSDLAADSPLSILSDIGRLSEQFEVREAGNLNGEDLLDLRAMDPEAEFDRVLLGLRGDELRMMTLEDAFGLRTEIRFSEITRNAPLQDELFRFVPPEGVDVIGNDDEATGGE